MYNNFHIEKSRIKDYPLIVYTLGYSQISDYILSLEVCLKNKDFKDMNGFRAGLTIHLPTQLF